MLQNIFKKFPNLYLQNMLTVLTVILVKYLEYMEVQINIKFKMFKKNIFVSVAHYCIKRYVQFFLIS